jgi:hypothetical protein
MYDYSFVLFLTGRLGNGKTLTAVARAVDTLNAGGIVATNVDLKLYNICKSRSNKDVRVVRLPDYPTAFDLEALPCPNRTKDVSKNGLLVLDECGTWLNARSWNEKGRKEFNNWLVQARKKGWNVIFIIQHIENVDAQVRKALGELTGFSRDAGKIAVPFFSPLWKLYSGKPLLFPKCHIVKIVNGTNDQTDPLFDRWIYRGKRFYKYYDTYQEFDPGYEHGTYSMLTPWHMFRSSPKKEDKTVRLTRILLRKYSRPVALAMGLGFGLPGGFLLAQAKLAEKDYIIAQLSASVQDREEALDQEKTEFQEVINTMIFSGSYSIDTNNVYTFDHPELGSINSNSPFFANVQFEQISDCAVRVLNQEIDYQVMITCDQGPDDEVVSL